MVFSVLIFVANYFKTYVFILQEKRINKRSERDA